MAQSRKRLLSLTLGALATLSMLAPAAHAHPDDTAAEAACLLTGVSAGSSGGIDSIEKDLDLNGSPVGDGGDQFWLLDTDSGSFGFAGTAICAAVDRATTGTYNPFPLPDGDSSPTVVAGNAYSFSGVGTFNNTICLMDTSFTGQASLRGDGTLVDLGEPGSPTDIDFDFGIKVRATVGAMEITGASGSVGHNVVTQGEGSGVIQILPTTGSCTTGQGVEGFTVSGAFQLSLSGNAGLGG